MSDPGAEYFDVVNERDEVVGRAVRPEVHARRLLHRAIHVLVFDETGRVFLQRRSLTKDSAPGLWAASCSGHVDSGEDYDGAARRELGEEIGVFLPVPPERWFRIEACAQTGWEFVWVYHLRHSGPFVLHPEEIAEGAWREPVELTDQIAREPRQFAGAFRLVWKRAREQPDFGMRSGRMGS